MNDPREHCPHKCKYCLCYAGEIERLQEELSLARLQRDAKLSSQTAVDEAAAREIERLREVIEEQNDTIKDLDQALAALENNDE